MAGFEHWGCPGGAVYGNSFPVPVSCCPPSLPSRTAQSAGVVFIVPLQLITDSSAEPYKGGPAGLPPFSSSCPDDSSACSGSCPVEKDLAVLVSSG